MDRSGSDAASWVDQELAGSTFKDERLGRRLRKLLVQMADAVGAPIPLGDCLEIGGARAEGGILGPASPVEVEATWPGS